MNPVRTLFALFPKDKYYLPIYALVFWKPRYFNNKLRRFKHRTYQSLFLRAILSRRKWAALHCCQGASGFRLAVEITSRSRWKLKLHKRYWNVSGKKNMANMTSLYVFNQAILVRWISPDFRSTVHGILSCPLPSAPSDSCKHLHHLTSIHLLPRHRYIHVRHICAFRWAEQWANSQLYTRDTQTVVRGGK